jgi:putative hydrolase of the HAD superfamily
MSAPTASRPSAVILDLFGTLVAAPSTVERSAAAAQFAETLRVPPAVVETALTETWLARHNGQLNSTAAVAAHLSAHCDAYASHPDELERLMTRLALTRLQADATLLRALEELRQGGARLVVLSDASPDIAEAWERTALAPHFHAVVFSCLVGAVKPAPQLFRVALEKLGLAAYQAVYCGDGGGDELAGAERAGMRAVRVARRGGPAGLVFGETDWSGTSIPQVEALPSLLRSWRCR